MKSPYNAVNKTKHTPFLEVKKEQQKLHLKNGTGTKSKKIHAGDLKDSLVIFSEKKPLSAVAKIVKAKKTEVLTKVVKSKVDGAFKMKGLNGKTKLVSVKILLHNEPQVENLRKKNFAKTSGDRR